MKKITYLISGFFLIFSISCTDDFDEINEQPDGLSSNDVSAKYFLTNLQKNLFKPTATPLWFGQIFHQDQYAGHHAGGHSQYIWNGDFGWTYAGWLQEGTNNWLSDYNVKLTSFLNFVGPDGALENEYYNAVGLIMKGFYYQTYTDQVGMIPYSEASKIDISLPKYDDQIDIYKGVIAELNDAIATIGDKTTGEGIEDLGENDVLFNGDLQKWKQLANSLKLRMALRAHGATGADFAASAASEAISSGVLADSDALFESSVQVRNEWVDFANYSDIWHGYGAGGTWRMGEPLINELSHHDDPRLALMSQPSKGGSIELNTAAATADQVAFLKSTLDNAGLVQDTDYVWTVSNDTILTIDLESDKYHIGLPLRLSSKMKGLFDGDLFSIPSELITGKSKTNTGNELFPAVVMTAADSHFMVAEAIVKGLASGDAAAHYSTGLDHAMNLWDTTTTPEFLASEMGSLSGTTEEKLEKIATQRWIVNYTNGLEAWSIVRDTGYPTSAITTSDNNDIRDYAGMNGDYPQRLRYRGGAYTSNAANVEAAVAKQGADTKLTKLWWAK